MRRNQGFKIKTINLDPDIFIQETITNHKLTVPLIRTLTKGKDRLKTKNKVQNLQKVIKNNCQISQVLERGEKNSLNLRGECGRHQERDECGQLSQGILKNNPKASLPVTSRTRTSKFERYSHIHSFADPSSRLEDPEKPSGLAMGEYQQPTQERESYTDLNPYTKDQYIYLRNRRRDQRSQIQRSGKINRMSSITKSYRIATISLTPQHSRRGSSLHTATTLQYQKLSKPPSRNAGRQIRQSEIKPWEALAFESREYFA